MHLIFDTDEAFSFETLRTSAYIPYGGADIGEVISTADRITPGDTESWHREWRALADRIAAIADGCAAGGHQVSARGAYLRASNYYRTAEFFLRDDPTNDPRVSDASGRAVDAFRSAMGRQDEWTQVGIPYEGVELSAYYLNVTGDEPGPTLLAHGGFDSTCEEMYFVVGEAARRYGWNCLIFEGGGQGAALRKDHLAMRHDWEAFVTPAVDVALKLPGVDPDRIALMGMSLGGYLGPRAVAFEPRIAACIAYDGIFNINGIVNLAGGSAAGSPGQDADPAQQLAALQGLIDRRTELPTQQRWVLSNALWVFGADTAEELAAEVVKYDLAGVADKITCPTLVCEGENDQFAPGQASKLYDALQCPKTFIRFTAAEGAGEHCQEGALNLFHQRMFDWLDDTLR
ncbi:alpha/beta hydrolase family protein [Aeromicrobium chenweiae]|uniref:Dipeptidyl aminopeptidase n=1 Tax=Aeromicrobium chenweiae TaxID=2079793 RepID=A0A2S0WNU0_9ACTN|nr:alpha/beta hydrolase [Aeromicrobium chenweiae]AWB92972.1 dipeptidyl aminopeptidase [Aeromicrobium chenweiae]TGN33966.1 alpha/beta hydrolase [Aeromicrobium chenweiae]